MKIKILIAVGIVVLVVGLVAGIKTLQIRKLMDAGKTYVEPPETVATAIVKEEKWQQTLSSIGTVTAVQGVTVAPEIAGTVKEIGFESGGVVEKGNLLVKLDTSSEQAQLRAVEAQVELAEINLNRQKALRQEKVNSQSDLDTIESSLKQLKAEADTIRATIEKKTIRAPFSGKLGLRQVNLGQYLDAGKAIVSLQSLAPIHTDFSLPQSNLPRLVKGMRVHLTADAYPGQQFEGQLTAITPEVDSGTRSVDLQATFSNTNQLLRPGMFVKVEVLMPEKDSVLVIPITSVLSAPYGDSVYIVEPAKEGKSGLVVRQQFIRAGRAQGDFVTVESGVKAGDKVVSAGVFKLRNGVTVVENNSVVPKQEMEPHPSES